MRLAGLATDYDGTIAHHGRVSERTQEALRLLKASGRKLLMVTGRELPDLKSVYPFTGDFDCIVAENGALLYWPDQGRIEPLAPAPPEQFIRLLKTRDVAPLSVGQVIVATLEANRPVIDDAISKLNLALEVWLNKGALMVLPRGVDKATGLQAALRHLNIPASQMAGVGDAENDYPFLRICGFSAAVANALPSVKEQVRWVSHSTHGDGVRELVEQIVGGTMAAPTPLPAAVADNGEPGGPALDG